MAFSLVLPETYPFSKQKQRKREKESFFAAKSKRALFFFSKLSLVFFLPIMAHVIEKLEHMLQTASTIERLECLV